jgi:hypothetical protein
MNELRETVKWQEYDRLAEWCAKNGSTGDVGTTLPANVGQDAMDEINNCPEAFVQRVRDFAYALAMEGVQD